MTFSDIYNRIDAEIEFIKEYVSSGKWDNKSWFFDTPKSGTLQKEKADLRQIINENNSQSGVYLFVCNNDTQVLSTKSFNEGNFLALLRTFDSDTVSIRKDDVLYVGECDCFSHRLSAHLKDNEGVSTRGLHLYSSNRISIKPENFKLILFPLKKDFYPNGCSKVDEQTLRELVELKLKAIYVPLVGK